jgi:MORN repeat protein
MSTILSLHDLPKEIVDLVAKAICDLKSWLNLRLTCKRCWTLCSLEQYRVQFCYQVVKRARKAYFRLPNKLRHGEAKVWHENGRLWIHSFFKDGQLEGDFKLWYKDGQPYQHSFYKEGKFEGEYKEWYENGQLCSHSFYKDGNLEGEYKAWHINGQLWEHSFFKDGKRGAFTLWNVNGQISLL